jgi:hypothetical protein
VPLPQVLRIVSNLVDCTHHACIRRVRFPAVARPVRLHGDHAARADHHMIDVPRSQGDVVHDSPAGLLQGPKLTRGPLLSGRSDAYRRGSGYEHDEHRERSDRARDGNADNEPTQELRPYEDQQQGRDCCGADYGD